MPASSERFESMRLPESEPLLELLLSPALSSLYGDAVRPALLRSADDFSYCQQSGGCHECPACLRSVQPQETSNTYERRDVASVLRVLPRAKRVDVLRRRFVRRLRGVAPARTQRADNERLCSHTRMCDRSAIHIQANARLPVARVRFVTRSDLPAYAPVRVSVTCHAMARPRSESCRPGTLRSGTERPARSVHGVTTQNEPGQERECSHVCAVAHLPTTPSSKANTHCVAERHLVRLKEFATSAVCDRSGSIWHESAFVIVREALAQTRE